MKPEQCGYLLVLLASALVSMTMGSEAKGALFPAAQNAPGLGKPIDEAPPLPLPTPTSKRAKLTFERLREGIKKYYKELWALEVEYEQTQYGTPVPWAGHRFAMKGEKRFCNQTGLGSHDYEYGLAYDGDACQCYQPQLRSAFIEKKKDGYVDLDAYARDLGIPVSDDDRASVSGTPNLLLPYVLDMRGMRWSVKPRLDVVDGAECHVLVCTGGAMRRLWIDPAIGYAMRFREDYQFVPGLPAAQLPLLTRYLFSDFQKTEAGVWMPKRIQALDFATSASPRSMWNRPSRSAVVRVKKVAVGNSVQDSVFRFQFPRGTEVRDTVHGRYYRIGKSGEELDFLVGKGREELAKSRHTMRLLLLNAAVVAVVAAWYVFLLLRRRRRAGKPSDGSPSTSVPKA